MKIGGLIGGLVAGALGSIIWACIAYFGNVEIGWIAWGIGAAIGFGVSIGSSNGGPVPAIVAVLITVASLCGGKYLAVQMAMNKISGQFDQLNMELSDEDCVQNLAYDLALAETQQGNQVRFLNGKNLLTAETLADYPEEMRETAQEAWDSKTPEEQISFRDDIRKNIEDALGQFKNEFSFQAFMDSFSAFDLLFFGLGIFTAGKIAFSDYVQD